MTKHKKTNTKVWVETSRDPAVTKNKHTTNLSGLLQFTRRSCSFEKLIQTCCKCTFYDRLAACVKIGSNVLKRITFTYLVLHPRPSVPQFYSLDQIKLSDHDVLSPLSHVMRYQYEASRWRANEQPSRDANEARFQKLPVNADVFTKNSASVWTVTQS